MVRHKLPELANELSCRSPLSVIPGTCTTIAKMHLLFADCVANYSLKPSDRPDIISRVFKIKLDALLKGLKDGSIFGKPKGSKIQFKEPNVIRLPFHLPNEQNILYEDHQLIENVIETAVSKDGMFIGWFKANKDFDMACTLTYAEMPSFFVWDKQGHMWKQRKQGHVIGRLTHIPHSHGEEYYLCLLLNYQKGCQTFVDVHSVGGIVNIHSKKPVML
ncbi:hypothetical protein AHAS_Ahas20G0136800 [Arachis hypogaea]